jgi:hypothetical protein
MPHIKVSKIRHFRGYAALFDAATFATTAELAVRLQRAPV